GILQRELVQAALRALIAEIDRRLVDQEHADAGHLLQLRPQLRDDLVDALVAFPPWFEVDRNVAGIQQAAARTAPGVVAECEYVRILRDDLTKLELVLDHLVEPDPLLHLAADIEPALIFARQEALRH